MNDDDYKEKRKHQRVHTRIEIPYWKYVKFKSRDEINIGFVKNMSRGGFFIETDVVYESGLQIGFEFYLPNSPKAISGVAQVRWMHGTDAGGGVPGMGLEFVSFEGDSEQILDDFVRAELAKQSGA